MLVLAIILAWGKSRGLTRILRVFSAHSPHARKMREECVENMRRIRGECAENTRQRYASTLLYYISQVIWVSKYSTGW